MSDEGEVDDELTYAGVWGQIEELAQELFAHPDPAVVSEVEELLDWVDVFHRDGLGRMVEMVRDWRGEIFLNSVAGDEITSVLLAVYGLGEGEELSAEAAAAVDAALAQVRPLVESHGGALEVDSIKDGVVALRMLGTCDGCPSSSATLTFGVEVALREHWPNFRRLDLLDPPAEADPAKADLECLTVSELAPDAEDRSEGVLVELKHPKR